MLTLRFVAMLQLVCLSIATLSAQIQAMPVRLEKKSVKYTETNSKYGTQTRTRSNIYIVYSDSTVVKATPKDFDRLSQKIPQAGLVLKKLRNDSWYQAASIPLFVAGFYGAGMYIRDRNNQGHLLFGGLSLATGVWAVNHFEWKKSKHERRFIEVCNRNLGQRGGAIDENKPDLSPDVIRVGFQNNGSVGIGLTWQLAK